MGTTINIDTGGTFTDGYFSRGDRIEWVKVETTPHDFSECLDNCIREGASRLGFDTVQDLLLDTEVFRFSSTIATNAIIQRSGPAIGLLVSPGERETLYGEGPSPLYGPFLRPDLVAEVGEPLDQEEVRTRVRELLVAGARILVVSLRGSEVDAAQERQIKGIVERDYPRHYLGAVPCLIASEVTPRPGAQVRTFTAVVNAYLHPVLVKTLYRADEDLRKGGLPRPLLVVQGSGGVARVAKTRAIETYNSGPIGGVFGSARAAQIREIDRVVTMDIGGTSTDVAVVLGGRVQHEPRPEIGGVPVHTPMMWVEAVGGGGGSIARRDGDGYRVGPDSAGASPGPACYGLGGIQPTVTDAEVVLGHINPDNFLGGRRRLDAERARRALAAIAGDGALGEAGLAVRRALVRTAAGKVQELVEANGGAPDSFVLFAYGGGGGLFAVDVARACGIPRVYCFRSSSVFSAFGIAGMPLGHVYEVAVGNGLPDRLRGLMTRAAVDVRGEGLDPLHLTFILEIDREGGEVESVELGEGWDGMLPGMEGADRLFLRAMVPILESPLRPRPEEAVDPSLAVVGEREVHTPEGPATLPIYERARLKAGHAFEGPGLVEGTDTTIVVPAGASLRMDPYLTAIIEVGR
jgi:N-methylhydantoinase A